MVDPLIVSYTNPNVYLTKTEIGTNNKYDILF